VAVVPVYTDGDPRGRPEAAPAWLWSASQPKQWEEYYAELLARRGLATEECAWIGLGLRGRTFGSAQGAPRWDELLGTALTPTGDAFGELAPVETTEQAAAGEAVAAAVAMRATGLMGALAAAPTQDGAAAVAPPGESLTAAADVLAAQRRFYAALTGGDEADMASLWAGSSPDAAVDAVISAGGEIDTWTSQLKPTSRPSGMLATDCDALLIGEDEAWSTTVERPAVGGTLLATQRWRRAEGGWLLVSHRTIPWDSSGGTAVATLRCDCRGCVALAREINTREVAQRGA